MRVHVCLHVCGCVQVKYDPSSGLVASASYDKTIRLWQLGARPHEAGCLQVGDEGRGGQRGAEGGRGGQRGAEGGSARMQGSGPGGAMYWPRRGGVGCGR